MILFVLPSSAYYTSVTVQQSHGEAESTHLRCGLSPPAAKILVGASECDQTYCVYVKYVALYVLTRESLVFCNNNNFSGTACTAHITVEYRPDMKTWMRKILRPSSKR